MCDNALPKPPPKEYWDDVKWAEEHYAELTRQYPNQWVAVVDQRVVSAGRSLRQVLNEAKACTDRPEFPHLFVERGVHVYQC